MNVKLKMNINTKNFTAMKKKLFFAAFALALFASCSDNDYVGDQASLNAVTGNGAISFNLNVPSITRSDKTGSDAATDLNNQFIVWGEKNETGGAAATAGNLVFKNYLVDWVDNSAYTTTSNTKGWEYVGLKFDDGTASPQTTTYSGNISPNSGTDAQTIKYWDYGATSYTFTAVSALPADITAGKVKITKTQSGESVYEKGYSVALTAEADLDKLYFAERNNIVTSSNTDRTKANQYGGNVTFRFHNMASKVRVAMYETVPGYSVTINKFSVDNDGDNPTFGEMTDDVTANFAANLQNCAKGTAGTMTVKYIADAGDTQNHPTVSFDGTKAKVLALGTNLAASKVLTTSAPDATYDKNDKSYTSVFPNETNTQNLKLKVSYTLTAPVTGETIEVNDKTAEVPFQYLQWKPGYAYTYIFKITDDNLYPITFDAVEVVDEDGSAEYITTVTEPSITTFGVKGGKYVAGKNEYEAGSDIYATFMNGSSVQKPSLTETTKANYVQIYSVTTSDATNFPITEVSVAERLATTPSGTAKLTCTNITTNATDTYFNSVAPAVVETVPSEDGNTKTIDALKLTGVKAGTYAVEIVTYTGSVPANGTSLDGYYSVSGDTYSAASGTANGTSTYYKQVKTYKVIKVVSGS